MIDAGLATPSTFALFAEGADSPRSDEIMFYGPIVSEGDRVLMQEWMGQPAVSALWLKDQLAAFEGDEIKMRINSPGGQWFEGAAVKQMIDDEDRDIRMLIDGVAGSFASVIALSGSSLGMSEMSHLVIHRPHSIVAGTADNMLAEAEILGKMQDQAEGFYSANLDLAALGIEDAGALMRGIDGEGTHITAQEMKRAGLLADPPDVSSGDEELRARRKDAFKMALASFRLSKGV